jgi:hypothetical protein
VAGTEDVEFGFGLLEPAVGVEQPGDVRIQPQRFEHSRGFAPNHPRQLAPGEEEGDPGARAGVAVGDSLKPGHGDPPDDAREPTSHYVDTRRRENVTGAALRLPIERHVHVEHPGVQHGAIP